jgi:hypothetical protein
MSEPQNLPVPDSSQTVATVRTTRARITAAAAATIRKIIRPPATGSPFPLGKYVRDFVKEYFDFLKNALVVAGLFYATRNVNSLKLNIVVGISIFIFVIGYWMRVAVSLEDFIKSKKWGIALKILSFPLFAGLVFVWFWAVVLVLNELVRAAQSH